MNRTIPVGDIAQEQSKVAADDRLIPFHEVKDRLGLGRTAIYALIKRKQLSPPVKTGPSKRASRWLESEVSAFIAAEAAARS